MPRLLPAAGTLVVLAVTGCTSYEPAPVEPLDVLADLERVGLDRARRPLPPALGPLDPTDGLTLVEAAAAAVQLNPGLAALRQEVSVSAAQLVEAGLLPDIQIGWGAGDPLSLLLVDGKVGEDAAWLAGASLTWQVPRPDEIDAREGVAAADLAGAKARVLAAEWTLVRDVQLAYVRLLAARARVEQVERLAGIAGRSLDYFRRARGLGAATALDENLARVASTRLGAEAVQAAADERLARQALNALLGLPPDADPPLQTSFDAAAAPAPPELLEEAGALVPRALARRPDVREAQAVYERAEQRLRLEVAQQWPQLSIGTGISLTLPFFSRFNQPAVRTAERARDAARRRLVALVQEVRREVHAARAVYRQAARLRELFRTEVEPSLAESLRLTERAFQVREVTPLQILATQQQVVETRARALEAQERLAAARIRLAAATGALLPELQTRFPGDAEDARGDR